MGKPRPLDEREGRAEDARRRDQRLVIVGFPPVMPRFSILIVFMAIKSRR
jgi:hypothetical protein